MGIKDLKLLIKKYCPQLHADKKIRAKEARYKSAVSSHLPRATFQTDPAPRPTC